MNKTLESHQNVLNEVIKKNKIMKSQLELAFSNAQKEIKRLNGLQNTMILLKNKTETEMAQIWDNTVVYVEEKISFFFKKISIICSVVFIVILSLLIYFQYDKCAKKNMVDVENQSRNNRLLNGPLHQV